jgi:hypothetical protein
VLTTNVGIAGITNNGIKRIQNATLRAALEEAYGSPAALAVIEMAHRVFSRLVGSKWPIEILAQFLSGWRSTHGTALFVSGLIIRLQREARAAELPARALLFDASAEMGEIIAEDAGVDDTLHNELFASFANQLVGDDRWQLEKFAMPLCLEFREYVKRERLSGPIEEAILITAASESWNSGEYSYADPLMRGWMKNILGFTDAIVENAIAYVSHHSGTVELDHFLHALSAWRFYCEAKGKPADPRNALRAFESYFDHLLGAFEELEGVLGIPRASEGLEPI